MAARRASTVHKPLKAALGDSNNSKGGSENSSGSFNGTTKKKASGRIVKSRYLQAVDRKQPAKNTVLNESIFVGPRPASPKMGSGQKFSLEMPSRRSLAPQSLNTPASMMSSILEPSQLGGSILQSTVLDGHCVHPEFDMSAIKEKTVKQYTADPENDKKFLEMQTFMLTFLTAKMESNTQKLKEEAEGSILAVMEEEEQKRKRLHEKKWKQLRREKCKQFNDLLDMQVAALTPAEAEVEQFAQEYKVFTTALDTTRHQLPVKNFHIEGDRREFLDKAEVCLKESEKVLLRCHGASQSGQASRFLSEIKGATQGLDEQLSRVFLDVLELAALVSRQTVEVQRTLEEDRLGMLESQALSLLKQ
ncbi:HAUS augmin-like complex subunit 8 [Paramormyrops kingsleyae]|uniref:HAUS augmin like complex subunit 8 n=1 Tax=Paramormyrops kingsleyae TaxID=1676925 RepID=A0A3B3TDJ0_9TELE|nr:HAUS augmin-like complex subunit 8 [Paramormyrops kingsleyae]XP_023699614.1 HAUS augmin-like complex subunit 8 [Paramormyrops kingsleyae]